MSSETLDLIALIDHIGVEPDAMDFEAVERLFSLAGSGRRRTVEEAVLAFAQLADPDGESLPLQVGRWRVDAGRQAIKAGLLTVLASLALANADQFDARTLTLTFVISVVPSVFDIERVELTAGQEFLLVELRKKPAFSSGFATPDEMYTSLSPELRRRVNRMDFADFLEAVDRFGALQHGTEGALRIRACPH
jgi:hypothetical protein